MSGEVFGQWTWRVRRKERRAHCCWCGQAIVSGERYAHHFGFSEDEWQHPSGADIHEECHAVMARDGWDAWDPYAPRPEKVTAE